MTSHFSEIEFIDLVGYPVEIQIVKGGVGPSTLTGNIYTVDPESNDIVVITFCSDKKPESIKWIPRHAINNIQLVDPSTAGCHPKDEELDTFIQCLFKNVNKVDPAECEIKKAALMAWLKRNHVDVKPKGSSLLIFGTVSVDPPFTSDDAFCDNPIVLKRVRAMIDKCPA